MSAIFHQAVLDGDVTKVRFLLKYSPGIRINHASKHGLTALQQAAWDGNFDLVNFLLEQGADLSLVDTNGYTALHLASQEGHLEVVSLLVNSACVNVNARTDRGQMAVDLAKTEPVRALLSQAMLTESFKRKCQVDAADPWDASDYYKNIPGCRYSLSSASTDSGVYDESNSDCHGDSKYLRARQRVARENSYENYVSRSTTSDYSTCSESRDSKPVYRKTDGSAVTSILKSQSFSGKLHAYGGGSGVRGERCPSPRVESARTEMERYRRPQRSYVRDPSRRRTVTFGETEKDPMQSTVMYKGSYTESDIPAARKTEFSGSQPLRSRNPPPIPPRASTLLKTPNDQERSTTRTTARENRTTRNESRPRDPRSHKIGFLTKSMH